jgi:hypothetical protein
MKYAGYSWVSAEALNGTINTGLYFIRPGGSWGNASIGLGFSIRANIPALQCIAHGY